MIIDSYGEGIPVAWLISNKDDYLVLLSFFNAIKERVGDITTVIFMSNDAEQFINAWQTVFSQPKKRLICSWHIDGSWRKNLGKYVQGLANQAVVFQMLKSLQMELDEATFRRLLQEFVTWIDKKHPEFAEYFRKEFLERIELWASCFRVGTPANTNMVTEAFHRLLKDVYCERKQNRRVDHLLAKLLVIARDKAYESWIKQEKGKVTYKIYEINIRHRRAKDILPSDIVQDTDDESKWKVSSRSQDGETYTIHYHGTCTAVCNVKCQNCHVCRHSYGCTCADFSLHALACKHIHVVHISVINEEDNVLPDIDVSPLAEEEQERRNREYYEAILVDSKKISDGGNDHTAARAAFYRNIYDLIDLARNCSNTDALRTANKHINSAKTVMNGIEKISSEFEFEASEMFPSYKKFETQSRFYSTVKRSANNKRPKLSKPDAAECKAAKRRLDRVTPKVCSVCFQEDDKEFDQANVAWAQCEKCLSWIHRSCEPQVEVTNTCSICVKSDSVVEA